MRKESTNANNHGPSMIEWYAVRNSKTANEFLTRNKDIKKLSYKTEPSERYGRLWVEDVYGNSVLLITDIPDGVIQEVRCYAPDDPSFIIFLLVKRGGSQILPEESPFFFDRYPYIKDKDYKIATAGITIYLKASLGQSAEIIEKYIICS